MQPTDEVTRLGKRRREENREEKRTQRAPAGAGTCAAANLQNNKSCVQNACNALPWLPGVPVVGACQWRESRRHRHAAANPPQSGYRGCVDRRNLTPGGRHLSGWRRKYKLGSTKQKSVPGISSLARVYISSSSHQSERCLPPGGRFLRSAWPTATQKSPPTTRAQIKNNRRGNLMRIAGQRHKHSHVLNYPQNMCIARTPLWVCGIGRRRRKPDNGDSLRGPDLVLRVLPPRGAE